LGSQIVGEPVVRYLEFAEGSIKITVHGEITQNVEQSLMVCLVRDFWRRSGELIPDGFFLMIASFEGGWNAERISVRRERSE
jgi:hypothetical protein